MVPLLNRPSFEVINLTPAARETWGRGVHSADLNFGDCFTYEVAREHDCRPLLVGEDFSRTDIVSVL